MPQPAEQRIFHQRRWKLRVRLRVELQRWVLQKWAGVHRLHGRALHSRTLPRGMRPIRRRRLCTMHQRPSQRHLHVSREPFRQQQLCLDLQ